MLVVGASVVAVVVRTVVEVLVMAQVKSVSVAVQEIDRSTAVVEQSLVGFGR